MTSKLAGFINTQCLPLCQCVYSIDKTLGEGQGASMVYKRQRCLKTLYQYYIGTQIHWFSGRHVYISNGLLIGFFLKRFKIQGLSKEVSLYSTFMRKVITFFYLCVFSRHCVLLSDSLGRNKPLHNVDNLSCFWNLKRLHLFSGYPLPVYNFYCAPIGPALHVHHVTPGKE